MEKGIQKKTKYIQRKKEMKRTRSQWENIGMLIIPAMEMIPSVIWIGARSGIMGQKARRWNSYKQ